MGKPAANKLDAVSRAGATGVVFFSLLIGVFVAYVIANNSGIFDPQWRSCKASIKENIPFTTFELKAGDFESQLRYRDFDRLEFRNYRNITGSGNYPVVTGELLIEGKADSALVGGLLSPGGDPIYALSRHRISCTYNDWRSEKPTIVSIEPVPQ